MRAKKIFVAVFSLITCLRLFGIEFYFEYTENSGYRVLSEVSEDVFINEKFSHHAEITNRAFVQIKKVHPDKSADFIATYTTADKSTLHTGEFINWGREYKSAFNVSRLGKYKIADDFYMPSVRDVPSFPDGNVEKGDVWQRPSSEAHDLGRQFGMTKPVIIPANTSYQYAGEVETEDGRKLHLILTEHVVNGRVANLSLNNEEAPERVEGISRQRLYWNNEKHRLEFYDEEFEISIHTNKENVMTFRGVAHAELLENSLGDEEIKQIQDKIEELDLDGVDVEKSDKGISLSIDSIQFEANSDRFLPGQDDKLEKIATILREFNDKNLLISGHTALAGTEETRDVLSLKRAKAVASYLESKGVRKKDQMYVEGMGARRPVADNDTEEGMAKNRRVEITILE